MNYMAAFTDFFQSPKWVTNLIFAAICCMVPVVGWMVVLGWLITGFWGREDESPGTFPDFDFGKLSIYLQRGLWPMLVVIIASVVVNIGVQVPSLIVRGVFGNHGVLGMLASLVSMGLSLVGSCAMIFVMRPLVLKATLEQDFAKSFDIEFVKKYVPLVWIEVLVSAIVLAVAAMVLGLAGMLAVCVGIFAVIAVLLHASVHIDKQLYKLYLSRGGAPLSLSPTLTDTPPTSPAPPAPPAA